MTVDNDQYRLFSRRVFLVGGGKLALLSLLAGRLYYLQIIKGDKYKTQAEDNRISLRLVAPPRGQILDRFGVSLAGNQKNYRMILRPEQVDDLEGLFDKIDAEIGLPESERKRIRRELKDKESMNTLLVRDNLTWGQVSALSLRTFDLPGADIEAGEVRTYPFTETFAHIIGYVGAVAQSDQNEEDPELTIPGFRIGKNGVEKQYDRSLRGNAGSVQLEVNVRGRVVRELARSDPMPGQNLTLTIDAGLQEVAKKCLAQHESAAAIAMDVMTGEVYALVSHPGFDPNLFTYGIGQQDWDSLNADEHAPLLNKAVDGVYAPGSTFKVVTALAALDAGILNPKATTYCPGHYELGNHKFHCWKRGGHGHVNFIEAMAGSCDTYFYDLGNRVGIDKIQAMAKRLGFGRKTGINLPHEKAGLMPGRVWKMAMRNSSWEKGETLIAAIGQGATLVTPLQLATVVARMVNGGFAVKPQVVKLDKKEPWPSLGIEQAHLDLVREAMSAVVTQQIGTAYSARIREEGMEMGGKTGTAQVRRISMAERREGVATNEELPWNMRDHALFMGFAPVANPRYAAAVVVEHGGSGAHVAAPIVRDILLECQKRKLGG